MVTKAINYINLKLEELEELKEFYKAENSKYNVTAIKKEIFTLNAIKGILLGDENMKDNILKRLEILESEISLATINGNIYKVQALKAEKEQLSKLLVELS